jgi:hypothetical protein
MLRSMGERDAGFLGPDLSHQDGWDEWSGDMGVDLKCRTSEQDREPIPQFQALCTGAWID